MTKMIRKSVLLMLIIGLASIITACEWGAGGSSNNTTNGNTSNNADNNPSPNDEPPQPAVNGEIIQINDASILVTAFVDRGDESYVDAYSLRVKDATEILDEQGATISIEDLRVGMQVETWSVGPVAESYPLQATAAKIVVQADEATTEVSRADAVRAAVEAQTEVGGAWSVREAKLDEEGSYWKIVLVHFMYMDLPVNVRVDAENGELLPNIVAENDAFRVYTPAPESEVGNVIAVEGEARVFEGVFSWTLEDGHTILAEGHVNTDAGAPAWGRFFFEASFEKASNPVLMLMLYVHSAKDGSIEQELLIPLNVPEELIQYGANE